MQCTLWFYLFPPRHLFRLPHRPRLKAGAVITKPRTVDYLAVPAATVMTATNSAPAFFSVRAHSFAVAPVV